MSAKRKPIAICVALCLAIAASALAQDFDLPWYTLDGGGYAYSTGGPFTLGGAIGQPHAGPVMTGGNFTLTGGFWTFPTPIPGDINGDGLVDVADLLWLATTFGTRTGDAGYRRPCDLNVDNAIDVSDVLMLARYWGM
jgi:hypothetical protein